MSTTHAPTRHSRLSNLLVALLGLGLCLWLTAAGWVYRESTVPHDYRLEVVREKDRIASEARGRQAWLQDLLVDGRVATTEVVGRHGSWRSEPAGSTWQHVCEDPAEPTWLSLRGATFCFRILRHPWSGGLHVFRDGELLTTLPLTSAGTDVTFHGFGVDLDVVRGLALLVAAAAAFAALRPWRGGGGLTAWLALLSATVHAEAWLVLANGVTNDSAGYLESTMYNLGGYASYFPPGYGVLVGLAGAIGGHRGLAVTFVQHVLMVLLAVALHRRFRQWCGERWSFVGALVGALIYPTLIGARAVMSESLTCVLLATPILLALQGPARSSPRRAVLAGLATGCAGLTRVIPLAVLLPVLAVRGMFPWSGRSWRWTVLAVGTAVAVVAVAVANTGLRSGVWGLSTSVGRHLYNHFVYEQKLLDPTGPQTRQLQALLGDMDLRAHPHWEVADRIRQVPTGEALFLPVSLEAARTVGLSTHLAFTAGLTWRNLSKAASGSMGTGDDTHGANPDLAHETLRQDPRAEQQLLSRSEAWSNRIWAVLCWLFVASLGATLLLREQRFEWLAWIWCVWAYMFASSAVEYELPRYHVAVAPMVVMLGVAAVGVVARRLWALAVRPPAA